MAYTIKINSLDESICQDIKTSLEQAIKNDGRFTAQISFGGYQALGSREGSRKRGYTLILKRIRLTQKKPYCGQHPGECLVNPLVGPTKKINATYLEWDDWVAFHSVVNDVLDAGNIDADVWSLPLEIKGRMWIRKGLKRRISYDYTDDYDNSWSRSTGLPQRIWNEGTADQFEA